jgi:hypothetical protein
VYAQSADWSAKEAEGFIKLYGMSSTLSARVNPRRPGLGGVMSDETLAGTLAHLGRLVAFDTRNPPRAIDGGRHLRLPARPS